MQINRYGFIRRLLHWAVGLTVLGLLAVGFLLYYSGQGKLPFELGDETTKMLFHYHKSLGLVVLGLSLLWLWIRQASGVPEYKPSLLFIFRFPAWIVHTLMFVALIAMPIVGWWATAAAGHPVAVFDYPMPTLFAEDKELSKNLFWLHRMLGLGILSLFAIHLLAAIFHGKIARDTINKRISLP